MTRNELKDIIKECIFEENNSIEDSSVEEINEDTEIELVTESIIGGILAIIFMPYIIALVLLVILSPILALSSASKSKKVEELITTNFAVSKAIKDLCDKCKNAILKSAKKDGKYLVDTGTDYLNKNNFKFGIDDKNELYIPLLHVDSNTILEDLYNTNFNGYQELCNHDDPDAYPPMKTEIRKLLSVLKSYVVDVNKSMKQISSTSKIKLVFDDEVDSAGYEPFFDGCFDDDEGIFVYLSIEFSDYSKIEISEKYKAVFDKMKAKFSTNKLKLK